MVEIAKMNPWFSICFHPKKTIAAIVANDPKRLVPDLAVIAGFVYALQKATDISIGDHVGLIPIILLSFFGGALNGWFFLYFVSAVVYYTGKCLKGAAEIEHIRAALSWSNVPIIWSIALMIWNDLYDLVWTEI